MGLSKFHRQTTKRAGGHPSSEEKRRIISARRSRLKRMPKAEGNGRCFCWERASNQIENGRPYRIAMEPQKKIFSLAPKNWGTRSWVFIEYLLAGHPEGPFPRSWIMARGEMAYPGQAPPLAFEENSKLRLIFSFTLESACLDQHAAIKQQFWDHSTDIIRIIFILLVIPPIGCFSRSILRIALPIKSRCWPSSGGRSRDGVKVCRRKGWKGGVSQLVTTYWPNEAPSLVQNFSSILRPFDELARLLAQHLGCRWKEDRFVSVSHLLVIRFEERVLFDQTAMRAKEAAGL